MPGEPTAMGEFVDGKGEPKLGLLAGEGTIKPGEGVGWACGLGEACMGAGLGCLMFGAGGLCSIPCGLAGVNGLLGGV